jgi:S-adenosylmethionine:tRNA ribosyltransferase-isomerase
MKTELFDYHLPPERIAQSPLEPRDASKLLVVKKHEVGSSSSGNWEKAERREVEPGIQVNNYAERANTLQGFRVADVPARSSLSDAHTSELKTTQWTSLPGMTESSFSELIFRDITSLLRPDDILVINDTRVMPARIKWTTVLLQNKKAKSKKQNDGIWINSLSFGEGRGEASLRKPVECLFLRNTAPDIWEIMCFPGERLKTGREIILENGMTLEIVGETYAGRLVKVPVPHHEWLEVLQKYGEIPLPPYITEHLANSELYQTVYAENLGSTAAPTAGRHFTPELLQKIQDMWVKIARVTLHIGPGTFKPIYEDDVTQYQIHSEFVTIPAETIELLKNRKGRVIAVGTTSMRAMESLAQGKLSSMNNGGFVSSSSCTWDHCDSRGEHDTGIQENWLREASHKIIRNDLTGLDSGSPVSLTSSMKTSVRNDGNNESNVLNWLNSLNGYSWDTNLYITPGYEFQLVDALITNFHAPRTSLLVLVAAFMGFENMMAAYWYALEHDFRFLSFGDAMWVERAFLEKK